MDIFKQLSESSLKYMLAFIFPMAVTITVLANRIIVLLYTNKYNDSIPVLRVLAWLLVLDFFNPFFSHILFARGFCRANLAPRPTALFRADRTGIAG